MIDLTAEQKIRYRLTGHPHTNPSYQHEGPTIVRWITGGIAPSIYAMFQHEDDQIILYCPQCREKLGQFNAQYEKNIHEELTEIRKFGDNHQKQHKS